MTAIQYAFLVGLTVALVAVAVFAASTTRAIVERRSSALESSWTARLGSALRPTDYAWAYAAHRVTGVGVFLFLAVHVLDVGVYALSPARFDEMHQLYGTAPMRVFECLLLYAILFHAFYGLRLLTLDLVNLGPTSRRVTFWAVAAASFVLGTAGSVVILAPLVD